jgi:hypothetical protein
MDSICFVIAGLTRNPHDIDEIAGQARNDEAVLYKNKVI